MKHFQAGVLAILLCTVVVNCADPVPTVAKPTTPKPTAPPTTTVTAIPTLPLEACPPQEELTATGCLCYPDMKYLICDGTKQYLKFKSRYQFKSLIIKNSPKLPFWQERLPKEEDFSVESLVILQNDDVEITDNFNELLRLPKESIKIISNGKIKSIDLSEVRQTLTSISVSNVQKVQHSFFSHFFMGQQSNLQHLQFRQVQFSPKITDLFLQGLPLARIEFSQSGLEGKFAFVPTKCPDNGEKIVIDLRSNNVTYVKFENLFPAAVKPDCAYHIDLSDNKLDANLLTSQLPILTAKSSQLYLRIHNSKLDCNCDLYKLYNSSLKNYLHSVECNTYGPLDQIEENKLTDKICPPPTAAPTTPTKPTTVKKT